ncbi:MAG: hypothetical protein QM770_03075 [Tepidisphaeraceae bacterium]
MARILGFLLLPFAALLGLAMLILGLWGQSGIGKSDHVLAGAILVGSVLIAGSNRRRAD